MIVALCLKGLLPEQLKQQNEHNTLSMPSSLRWKPWRKLLIGFN